MDRATFEHNARGADTFRRLAECPEEACYWEGYLRGLRRHYHGNAFGSFDEHRLWHDLVNDPDRSRSLRGVGYRSGHAGTAVARAANQALLYVVQLRLGLTNRAIAELFGQSERSVELYRQGRRPIKGPTERILRTLLEKG